MNSQAKQVKFDFLRKIKNYFSENNINPSDKTICVCLSGGADSVALLLAMKELADEYSFNLFAAHFNHMIRGEEADRDEAFCKKLCDKLSVRLYCGRDDVPAYARLHGVSVEAAARECRYSFFERIMDRNYIDYCATAHNMNDDAETLIFNIIRGSGSNGGASIAPIKERLLRPLLKTKRCEIEAYLASIEQDFVTDSTNASQEYTRNYIRHTVIPSLEKINPAAIESISKYIESARADKSFFDKLVAENLETDLRLIHSSIRDRVIIKKFLAFSGKSLNYNLLKQISNALLTHNRYVIDIYNTYEAVINNGLISFYNKSDNFPTSFDYQTVNTGINSVFADRVSIEISNSLSEIKKVNKIYTLGKLSFDKICGELRVRSRRQGDKILIRGINRSIKKLFIENKIPKEYRDIVPIFCDDVGIIYVPFIGICDRVLPENDNHYVTTVFNTINTERWNNAYEE